MERSFHKVPPMSDLPFTLHSWTRAIIHLEGNAFFTSCKEAIHPELREKPIITGGERSIVACASNTAKRLGIKRGVPIQEARRYQLAPARMIAFLKKAHFDMAGREAHPPFRGVSPYRDVRQGEAGRTNHKGADPALRREPPQTPGTTDLPHSPKNRLQLVYGSEDR
jgi:hypothetical protein